MPGKISLTQNNLKDILDAFEHFFPVGTVYSADKPFTSISGEYSWPNRSAFVDFIFRLTDIKIASDKDFSSMKQAQQKIVSLVAGVIETEEPISTLPDKQTRATQEEEAKRRQEEIVKTREIAKKNVEEEKNRLQKIHQQRVEQEKVFKNINEGYEKKIETLKEIEPELVDKVIYVKVEPPPLEKPDANIERFIKEVKTHPQEFRDEISNNIRESFTNSDLANNLSADEISIIADKTATDIVFAVNNPSLQVESNYQVAILDSLSKSDNVFDKVSGSPAVKEFLKTAPSEMAFFKNSTQLSRNVLSSFNQKLATAVFGHDPQKIKITFYETYVEGCTHSTNLGELNNGYSDLIQTQSQFGSQIASLGKGQAKQFLMGHARTFLDQQVAMLPKQSLLKGLYNGAFGQKLLNFVGLTKHAPFQENFFLGLLRQIPGASPFMETLGGALGINFGITTAVPVAEISTAAIATTEGVFAVGGSMAGTGIATLTGAEVAAGAAMAGAEAATAGTAASVAAGAGTGFLSGLATGPGAIITAIVGFLVGLIKALWPKIKEFFNTYGVGIGAVLLGGGIMIGSPVMIAAGVPILIFSVPIAGGLKSVTGKFGGLLKIVLAALVLHVGKPLIIFILSIPIVVAFMLLLINSGAYVTQPSTSFGQTISPYIEIIKTPKPPGPFKNTALPQTITYEVSIRAKKGALTNVNIKYDCKVISTSQLECPAITDIPSTVNNISPSKVYTFTYTSTYDQNYKDSAIIDTITVTADVVEEKGVSTEGSASVMFGKPPISCPVPNAKPVNSINYSYNSPNNTGHGSTTYWTAMGGIAYRYNLPQMSSCKYPSDCPYYGFAYDVFPNGTTAVYLPEVLGKSVEWTLDHTFSNGSAGYSLIYIDSSKTYTLVLTHVASESAPSSGLSGTKVSTLFNQGSNTHLHIEFQISGRWVKPEDYFCK